MKDQTDRSMLFAYTSMDILFFRNTLHLTMLMVHRLQASKSVQTSGITHHDNDLNLHVSKTDKFTI